MKQLKLVLFLNILIVISACSPQTIPAPTTNSQVTETPTLTQALTPTLTPTVQPLQKIPVSQNTPVPFVEESINANSAENVQLLAKWGRGEVRKLSFVNNSKQLLITSSTSETLINTNDLTEIWTRDIEVNNTNLDETMNFPPTSFSSQKMRFEIIENIYRAIEKIEVFDINTGDFLFTLEDKLIEDFIQVLSIDLSADNQKIYTLIFHYIYGNRRWISHLITWDAHDGKYISRIELEQGWRSYSIKRVMENGNLVIFEDNGKTQIINPEDGKILRVFQMPVSYGSELFDFSADGKQLAFYDHGDIRLINLDTSNLTPIPITQENEEAELMALSNDGKNAVVTIKGAPSQVIDIQDGKTLFEIPLPAGNLCSAAFSAEGSLMAAGSMDKHIYIYRLPKGELIHDLKGHTLPVCDLLFSPNGDLLASASEDRKINIWNLAEGESLKEIASNKFFKGFMAFSPDNQTFAISSGEGIIIWKNADWQVQNTINIDSHNGISKLFFSGDGSYLIAQPSNTDGWENLVYMYSTSNYSLETVQLFGGGAHTLLSTIDDKDLLVVNEGEGIIKRFNIDSKVITAETPLPIGGFTKLCISDNSKYLITQDESNKHLFMPMTILEESRLIKGYYPQIYNIFASKDNQTLAIQTSTNEIIILDLSDGSLQHQFSVEEADEYLMSISPDFNYAITYAYNMTKNNFILKKRSIVSGGVIDEISQVKHTPSKLIYSPDGKYFALVTLYTDKDSSGGKPIAIEDMKSDVFLYDINTNEQVLFQSYGALTNIEFSPDGLKMLVRREFNNKIVMIILSVPGGDIIDKITFDRKDSSEYISSQFTPDSSGVFYEISGKNFLFDLATQTNSLQSGGTIGIYSPDGSILLKNSRQTLDIIDTHTWIPICELDLQGDLCNDFIFMNNGKAIICATDQSTIKIWGIHNGPPPLT